MRAAGPPLTYDNLVQVRPVLLPQQEVLRLEIPVADVILVQVFDRSEYGGDDDRRIVLGEVVSLDDGVKELPTLDELEDEEVLVFRLYRMNIGSVIADSVSLQLCAKQVETLLKWRQAGSPRTSRRS